MKRKAKATRKTGKRAIRSRHTGRVELSRGTFVARWMVDGKRFARSTGVRLADYPDGNAARAAAEDWLQNQLRHIQSVDALADAGLKEASLRAAVHTLTAGALTEINAETKTAHGSELRIGAAFTAYETSPRRKAVKPSTMRVVKLAYGAFERWMTAAHPEITLMREVTPFVAEEFARHLRQSVGPSRYNLHLVYLRRIWTILSREIGTEVNPWNPDNLPKQTIPPVRPPSVHRRRTPPDIRRRRWGS